MNKIKYLIVIPALAAISFVVPAAEPAYGEGSFGISFSYSVPFYDPYPTYYYPYSVGTRYGWRDNRDRHHYRFKHRYPRHYYHNPRYDRHYGRHHYYDRHNHRGYRGDDRW
jgi:hypothetical protein